MTHRSLRVGEIVHSKVSGRVLLICQSPNGVHPKYALSEGSIFAVDVATGIVVQAGLRGHHFLTTENYTPITGIELDLSVHLEVRS